MLVLVLAAVVTMEQALKAIDDFCTQAELEVQHPVTQQMFTRTSAKLEKGIVLVRIHDRYRIDYYRGKVRGFGDLRDDGKAKLGRLDPDEMKKWSEQPCLLDEAGARAIAERLFHRMGYDQDQFEPVEVHRYRWQPSEADPDHVLWLPLFWVNWHAKGHSRDQAVPPGIRMEINGTSKKLVYFHDSTRAQPSPLSRLLHAPASAKASSQTVLSTNAAVILCNQFAKAAGLRLETNWQQQAKFVAPTSESDLLVVALPNRYVFELKEDRVYQFQDHDQWLPIAVAEQHTLELRKWVSAPTTITETQAIHIAERILTNLGFPKRTFSISKLEQVQQQLPNPMQPDRLFPLPPSYRIQWVGKRPWWGRHGMPDIIRMEIFGANGELVHYWHSPNNYHFWPTPMMKWFVLIPLTAATGLWILRWYIRSRYDRH